MNIKNVLLFFVLLTSVNAFSQSHKAGTITPSVTLEGLFGQGSISFKSPGFNIDEQGSGFVLGYHAAFKFSVGVSDKLGIGFFIRKEGSFASFASDENNDPFTADVNRSGFGFAPEIKYYITNVDKVNVYTSLSVGYSKATDNIKLIDDSEFDMDVSGVNYGLGLGVNWFFKQNLALSVDLDLAGNTLRGEEGQLKYSQFIVACLIGGGLVWKIN